MDVRLVFLQDSYHRETELMTIGFLRLYLHNSRMALRPERSSNSSTADNHDRIAG